MRKETIEVILGESYWPLNLYHFYSSLQNSRRSQRERVATPPSSLVYGLYKPAQRPAHWMLVPHRHAHHKTGLDRKMKMEIIACSGADTPPKKRKKNLGHWFFVKN